MVSADDWQDGGIFVLRNSSFLHNRAEEGHGGVVTVSDFASLLVEGVGNVFARNEAFGGSGAVFDGKTDSRIAIEGGHVFENTAEKVGTVRVGWRLCGRWGWWD